MLQAGFIGPHIHASLPLQVSISINEISTDLTLQGAIRYDIRRAEPFRDDGTVIRAGTVQRRDFNGVSGAASGIYHWTDRVSTGTTIMKTFRAPGIEELFSDGPHLAAYSYEIGNVELEPENGYGIEAFGRYAMDRFNLNLTVFQNHIHGYLTPTNTGEKEWGKRNRRMVVDLPIYRTGCCNEWCRDPD